MSLTIKNILYPTDFSDNAKNALPFALELAKKTGAMVHIMHSIEEPYDFAPMVEDIKKNVTRKVKQLYEEMLADIKSKKEYESVNIKTHIFEGRTVHSLLSVIEDYKMDLVVMGTQGRSALERLFFGSTTSEVVQQAMVPVLTIPEKARHSEFKHILFTTDYGPEDLKALKFTTEYAKLYDADIKVIHVTKKLDQKADLLFRGFKDLVSNEIKYKKMEFKHIESEGLLEGVTKEVEKKDVSMIVMVRYQHIFSIIGKKHSKEMSQSTKVPLMVLPGKPESSKGNVII
ncbi:MAG: universal stress protein [Gracilimonas sp.]|uniref:universal stress protein n=1 Tax=Gracilimonas sp. TaxID=1974203 RepID=UPI0019C480A9|nr:universal stress protein [Gracilimonas sp.]MBD3616322.1 universal stress protein [Gracilimonas sp.]